ncbi:MAG TPA: TetR/AcrR family transcriptional regulator [Beijerinckiaceae bacterium]|jgi:AcrR family transcriptional regulator
MPRNAPPEPTDSRILEIAADHVRRFGLARTTVVSIAAEAGMSHANVYRYFPSKESLIDALTDHWLKPIEAGLHDIADGPDPADDKLERIVSALYRAYRNKVETDPNLFKIFVEAMEEGRAISRRHRSRLQAEILRVIDEGMQGGVFRAGDQRRAMALIFDGLHRFIHPVSVRLDRDAPREQMDARFERLTRVVLRALSGRL